VSDTPAAILDRLVELDRHMQEHKAALWLLKGERAELRTRLRLLGWQPPAPKAAA
jgi:hypothetical protein